MTWPPFVVMVTVLLVVSFVTPSQFADGFRYGTVFGCVIGSWYIIARVRRALRRAGAR